MGVEFTCAVLLALSEMFQGLQKLVSTWEMSSSLISQNMTLVMIDLPR